MKDFKKFLRNLNIKPISTEQAVKRTINEWDKLGVTEKVQKLTENTPEFLDYLFFDEKITILTYSKETERLENVAKMYTAIEEYEGEVLEFGSGAGLHSLYLAKKFPETNFYCYDICKNALKVGQAFAKKLNIENVHFIVTLPKPKEKKFNFILMAHTFHYFKDFECNQSYQQIKSSNVDNEVSAIDKHLSPCLELLDPEGCLCLSDILNPKMSLALIKYLSEKNLGLDLINSHFQEPETSFAPEALTIYVSASIPNPFKDYQDLLSHLYFYAGELKKVEKYNFTEYELDPLLPSFQAGELWLEGTFEQGDQQGHYEVRQYKGVLWALTSLENIPKAMRIVTVAQLLEDHKNLSHINAFSS